MVKQVVLPPYFNEGGIAKFTRDVIGPDGFPRDSEILFDFSKLRFVDGVGLTVFCNTIDWLMHKRVKCVFHVGQKILNESMIYMDDCGFFEKYTNAPLRSDRAVRDTTLPIKKIDHAHSQAWMDFHFTPWMCIKLNVNKNRLSSLKTCINEIFNNIKDHSSFNEGFIHVQHYPRINRIDISISDIGVGIPSNIKRKYGEMPDKDAILKASQEGVTSKSHPNNMGIGLDYLSVTVASNGGRVSIHSGYGLYICRPDRNGLDRESFQLAARYPGTLVDIQLPIDRFIGDEEGEEEEFEW